MRKKVHKNPEFDHFKKLSNEWWNPNGKFKVLHTLTPIRIKYIKDNICMFNNNSSKSSEIQRTARP